MTRPACTLRVDLVRDEAERTVELADDFAVALAANAYAQDFFHGLSHSQALGLADPRSPRPGARRIEKYVGLLAEGRAR